MFGFSLLLSITLVDAEKTNLVHGRQLAHQVYHHHTQIDPKRRQIIMRVMRAQQKPILSQNANT